MEVIQELFVATQLLRLTDMADYSFKDRLWETQQRWCVPHHYSCRVKYPNEDSFVNKTRSQQGTHPNNYSTQQVNQSSTTAATGDPDRSSTQNVNHNSPTAATEDDDHNVTHLANQSSPADITEQSACCGFCSCEDDCAEYGSCCLSEYRNLNYGREMVDKAAAKYVFTYIFDSTTQHQSVIMQITS